MTSSSNAATTTQKWSYQPNDQTTDVTYYHVNGVKHSELDDSSGHIWQCKDFSYDEGRATTVTTQSDCSNPSGSALSSYRGYDQYGNPLTSVDAFGASHASSYGSTNKEFALYDAAGERVLTRSISGSGTSLTTYAFGLEEHSYNGSGVNQSNTYYYSLAGHLIGKFDGSTTQYYLTDALGSVLSSFNAVAGSATLLGNQTYGPYGNKRYSAGAMGTDKGYTGQYADALTGLDYYHARYYDPVVGQFVSADTQQGNPQGMNPYAYVAGNPETLTDPTGQAFCADCGEGGVWSYGGGQTGSRQQPEIKSGGALPSNPLMPPKTPTAPKTPPPPHTGCGGCKAVFGANQASDKGCNNVCGDHDKESIISHIQEEQAKSEALVSLIADGIASIGDLISAAADAIGGAWIGFLIDAGSFIIHFGAMIADASIISPKHFMPSWLVATFNALKNLVFFVDAVKGVLDLFFNPLQNGAKFLKWLIPENAEAKFVAGLAEFALTGSYSFAGGFNYIKSAAVYEQEKNSVTGYSNEQAQSACLQIYGPVSPKCG